jgi:hypothetical protein
MEKSENLSPGGYPMERGAGLLKTTLQPTPKCLSAALVRGYIRVAGKAFLIIKESKVNK